MPASIVQVEKADASVDPVVEKAEEHVELLD